MVPELLIRGGAVVTEAGVEPADVLVRGEVIAAVGQGLRVSAAADVLDASLCLVFPGFIDLHVHVGEAIGGLELADDFESATRLALCNGVTCLGVFAHQAQGTVSEALETLLRRAKGQAHCDFTAHLAPTRFATSSTTDDLRGLAASGARTLKLYTTYQAAGLYAAPAALRDMLALAAELDLCVLVHCEDDAVVTADPSRPVEAEVRAIEALVEAVARSGARAHVVHVSSPEGLAAAQTGRATGRLTVETCPQYLCFDERLLFAEHGHRLLCSPPLRSDARRAALVAAVARGEVDALATDHCPFSAEDKDRHCAERARVPRGLPGLGALVPTAFDLFMDTLGPVGLSQLLSHAPARIAGLYPRKGAIAPGSDADLAVLCLGGEQREVRSTAGLAHDPYAGRKTTLEVRHVLTRGRCAVRSGQWRGDSSYGRLAWRS